MPQHRKSMVLARFYDEIEKIANGGTPSVAAKQNTNVVPAVAGGTKSSATRNDLGSYIEDAFKAFGAK